MTHGWGRWPVAGAQVGLLWVLGLSPVAAEWEKGVAAFQAGQYQEAVREFREVVGSHPKSAAGYYMLGSAHFKLQQPSEAIASLRRAARLDSSSASYALTLAEVHLSLGQQDSALDALEAHSPANLPQRKRAKFATILVSAVNGSDQPERALAQLERVTKLLPGEAQLWSALGKARGAGSDHGGSFSAYLRALEVDPRDTLPGRRAVRQAWLVAEAQAPLAKRDWYRKGADLAKQLSAEEPSVTHAGLAGNSYLQAEDYSTARHWLETAQALDPASPEIAYSLARCSLGLEEGGRSLRELEAAYQKAKGNEASEEFASIVKAQGFAYHKAGDYRRAAEAYRRVGNEAKALEMEGYRQVADSNGEIERRRKECLAKKQLVDREREEMAGKKGLFSALEWLEIERNFARQLADCQPYLDGDEIS